MSACAGDGEGLRGVALARLIRSLHRASAGWAPPPWAVWGGTPANAGQVTEQAELVSHQEYHPGNVVFRDGRARRADRL